MPKGECVYVPEDARAVYTESPADRRSITLIKGVCVTGKTIPPVEPNRM
jgi:hypothetical protein